MTLAQALELLHALIDTLDEHRRSASHEAAELVGLLADDDPELEGAAARVALLCDAQTHAAECRAALLELLEDDDTAGPPRVTVLREGPLAIEVE